MPGFASRLSDDEVAQLATFVRQSWGNKASTVTVSSVKAVRENALTAATAP
jgi:mono/diheme cytochrome c family protein